LVASRSISATSRVRSVRSTVNVSSADTDSLALADDRPVVFGARLPVQAGTVCLAEPVEQLRQRHAGQFADGMDARAA
jgi:hypothetical protein